METRVKTLPIEIVWWKREEEISTREAALQPVRFNLGMFSLLDVRTVKEIFTSNIR